MIRAAVVGVAGYTGGELARLLLSHPEVGESGLIAVSSSSAGKPLAKVHPDLIGWTKVMCVDSFDTADIIFLCLGHGHSVRWIAEHPHHAQTRIIDLSADHRDISAHPDFTYGLPEKYREQIRNATRIANPGCFATAIELALLPLAEAQLLTSNVVVHAITGSTGAGVQPSDTTHFSWRDSNVSTYKTFTHISIFRGLSQIFGIASSSSIIGLALVQSLGWWFVCLEVVAVAVVLYLSVGRAYTLSICRW